jgi:hypothetical protein
MNEIFNNCSSLKTLTDLFISKNNINDLKCQKKDLIYTSKIKYNNINMSPRYEKSFSIFKLEYEIKDEKKIKLFDSRFIKNNKNLYKKCKMIIDNKMFSLKDEYEIINSNIKNLKIKLTIPNGRKINLSYMFYGCKSLKKFSKITEEKNESGNKLNSSNYIEINIINKSTKKKKTKIKFDVSKISYHCSIIHGIYYKYKLFNFLTKNEIVFSCENPKCESYGIFDINEKTFTISKPHWDGTSIICYHNQMKEDDIDNYNYMIKNNLDEIQIYSDNNK